MVTSNVIFENGVSFKDGLKYIDQLDLSYLETRLVDQLKWSKKEAQEAVRKYKNFLRLQCKFPSNRGVPTDQIDEAWHNHILYTERYIEDCDQIFGKYLHHYPKELVDDQVKQNELDQSMHQLYIKTGALYELEFSEPFDKTSLIEYGFNEN